jgi:hypothetical protein
MQHDHIIKLFSHFEDEEHVNLLMEYNNFLISLRFVSGGSIYGRI